MTDILRPINHSFTKKTGKKYELFDLDKLRNFMSDNYQISYIEVNFGRSEIEEYLILRWRETLTNKPALRLLKGEQYSWVKTVKKSSKLG